MKVLVDTCVWSLLLRRGRNAALTAAEQSLVKSLTEVIKDGRAAIIGPIRQEVLSGVRELAQFERLRARLGAFRDEPLTSLDFESAARLFNLCRTRGVGCGSTDILLCAVACARKLSILTNDSGIQQCMRVLQSEGLMQ